MTGGSSLRSTARQRARGGPGAGDGEEAEAERPRRRSGGASPPLRLHESTLGRAALSRVLPPEATQSPDAGAVTSSSSPPTPFFSPAPTPAFHPADPVFQPGPLAAPESAGGKTGGQHAPPENGDSKRRKEAERLKALLSERSSRPLLVQTRTSRSGGAGQARDAQGPLRAEELDPGDSSDSNGRPSAHVKRVPRDRQRSSEIEQLPSGAEVPVSSSSSYDSDHGHRAAQRRQSSGARGRQTLSSLKERAGAARRANPRRQKCKSVLRYEGLRDKWEDDSRLEREELSWSKAEQSRDALTRRPRDRVAPSEESSVRAQLERIDGMLDAVILSSEFEVFDGNDSRPPVSGTGSLKEVSLGDTGKKRERHMASPLGNVGWVCEGGGVMEKEMARASRHVANRLASAFDTGTYNGSRGGSFGRDDGVKLSERARSHSPTLSGTCGPESPRLGPEWIARHTYASLMKARPVMPRAEEGCKNCEVLDTLLRQREEKISGLKSDLVMADAVTKKLRDRTDNLEETLETIKKQNAQTESQLVESIEACRTLAEEAAKVCVEPYWCDSTSKTGSLTFRIVCTDGFTAPRSRVSIDAAEGSRSSEVLTRFWKGSSTRSGAVTKNS